ncbi:MAG: hypothetical protein QME32_08180 [Endomicrobiia bacterium]|nr:hypothetical protein [Endomicrobiia bacterium]
MKMFAKIILFALNFFLTFIIGVFCGMSLFFLAFLAYPRLPFSMLMETETKIYYFLIYLLIFFGVLVFFMEMKYRQRKIIRYFYGDIVRKVLLIFFLIFGMRMFWEFLLTIDRWKYGKYRDYAAYITNTVSASAWAGKNVVELERKYDISHIFITDAMGVKEEKLLETGQVNKELAEQMSRGNPDSGMSCLYIVKDNRFMAQSKFDPHVIPANRFLVLHLSDDKIKFYIRKKPRGGTWEVFEIYKVE